MQFFLALACLIFAMYACQLCNFETCYLKAYCEHYRVHRNVHNFKFPCAIPGCTQSFSTYSGFNTHVSRNHSQYRKDNFAHNHRYSSKSTGVLLKCNLGICGQICENLSSLIKHLKTHIDAGLEVKCPFQSLCPKSFRNKSSFTSHISRYHKKDFLNSPANPQAETCDLNVGPDDQTENNENAMCHADSDIKEDECRTPVDLHHVEEDDNEVGESISLSLSHEDFTHNVALFCLKLQSELLIPERTVQKIVEELENMQVMASSVNISLLQEKLKSEGVSDTNVKDIIDYMQSNDLWRGAINNEFGTLRSSHMRKMYYQSKFEYVKPKCVCLGRDHLEGAICCHYIPIKDTLCMLLNDKSVQKWVLHTPQPNCSDQKVLSDFTDGCSFKANCFFKTNSPSLQLILFQDAFEVVNPLGSSKTKYKVLAVYMSLGNIPPQFRSLISQIQLVLLCREKDFKRFGQAVVFGQLIDDLKELEELGIETDFGNIKGSVVAITGDNLGSHCIGGFSENFSTVQCFCRHCEITRDEIENGNPFTVGKKRTKATYEEALQYLEENPHVYMHMGIKFDSVFNTMKYFHVCEPGLPPCLGHDLFEGVVSFDLSLYLNYFIKLKEWFTYNALNRRIQKFKYLAHDVGNQPAKVNVNGKVLGGHAVQNWNLLRLLPFLIGDKIVDSNDLVWRLCLQLREVTEYVCAPSISKEQVSYLRVIVDEYLESRKTLFPQHKLKPKHHFLAHYAAHTLKYGPLIRLWTMRFESKHSYFKRCLHASHNYKNITKTLSERHQLLQAYYSSGQLLPSVINFEKAIPLHSDLYVREISLALFECGLNESNAVVCEQLTHFGTMYKKGLYVLVSVSEQMSVAFGKILMTVVQNGCTAFCVVKICDSVYVPHLGLYQLLDQEEPVSYKVRCIPVSCLLDWFPLPAYEVEGQLMLALKHQFVQ